MKQNADWKKMSIFFRQWMIRDFKKNAGMPMDEWCERLQDLELGLKNGGDAEPLLAARPRLEQLHCFYDHLIEAQRGYQKDQVKREEGGGR